jgi:hypothetical protein
VQKLQPELCFADAGRTNENGHRTGNKAATQFDVETGHAGRKSFVAVDHDEFIDGLFRRVPLIVCDKS